MLFKAITAIVKKTMKRGIEWVERSTQYTKYTAEPGHTAKLFKQKYLTFFAENI